MRRLVITGTRRGRGDVRETLDAYLAAFDTTFVLVLGDARGVDQQAFDWASRNGAPVSLHRADWSRGPKAGPERNQRMIDAARPGDHLLAFPDADSRGTWDAFRRGQKAGLLCVEVKPGWLDELRRMSREGE